MSRIRVLRLEPLEDRVLMTVTPWSSYARDAQHTGQSTVPAQSLDVIHWETPVDSAPQYTSNGELLIHYGSPLVTAANTVIVPEKNEATSGFDINAFDGATGALKWTQTQGEEYQLPASSWTPSYSPALAQLPTGPRLYFPGADGTVFYRDSPDAAGPAAVGRIAFYGNGNYSTYASQLTGVRISSPLTVDSQGNLFFSYRVTGSNPLGLQSGIARIGADGSLTYAQVGTPALNSAPALSNDETKLYNAVNGDLVEYDSTTLTQLASVPLGTVVDQSSSSPTVGPDGDVYFGVLSPFDDDRGSLEHFSGDLSTTYTPGSFGWDDTVTIVPASMVPNYVEPSTNQPPPYLLMTKYNDYAGAGGTGINQIAIIDPNSTQIDPVTGRLAMTTVLSIAGVTPDDEFPNKPGAVREWCINNAVVDPATHSIFANSEDGWLYRWDTWTNTFTQQVQLTAGVGEAYTPTVIGADGTVFAINNATLFAVGATPSLSIDDVSIVEGNSGTTSAVFTVSLSSSSAQTVMVNFATADGTATAGSDYQGTSGILTFAPATTAGGGVTTQTITVPIQGDTQLEADETFVVNLSNPTGATIARAQAVGTIVNDDAAVVTQYLFYKDSPRYDLPGGSNAQTPLPFSDDNAIATDKSAYIAGTGPATFANISSYTLGINGLMVDVAGDHGAITSDVFIFKTGNNNAPGSWTTIPSASATVTVRPGAGTNGSDRVEITFANNLIQKTWLEVIFKGNDVTGGHDTVTHLPTSDVFFFGNAVADDGIGEASPNPFITDPSDVLAARSNPMGTINNIPITNIFDYDRTGTVDPGDVLAARSNSNGAISAPKCLNISGSGPFAPSVDNAGPVSTEAAILVSGDSGGGALGGDSGLASALTALVSSGSVTNGSGVSSSPPAGLIQRLRDVDLNNGRVAQYFEDLIATDTATRNRILVAAEHVAESLDTGHEWFDALLAELGFGPIQ